MVDSRVQGTGSGCRERCEPVAVISPHLDDGVLSCGRLLAAHPGSAVVTVFAGQAPPGEPPTPWDLDGGFGAGDDVVLRSREEDRTALRHLGATSVWLKLIESQYGANPTVEGVADEVDAAIAHLGMRAVYVPLGLFHSEHRLVSEACLTVMQRRTGGSWLAYEEAQYRRLDDLLEQRLGELRKRGVLREAETGPEHCAESKYQAVTQYTSQLRALTTPGRPGYADCFRPERYWRLASNGEMGGRRGV